MTRKTAAKNLLESSTTSIRITFGFHAEEYQRAEEVGDNLQIGPIISFKQAGLAGLNLQFRINHLSISLAFIASGFRHSSNIVIEKFLHDFYSIVKSNIIHQIILKDQLVLSEGQL